MTTLISSRRRHAAHDRHRCGLCQRPIAKAELYEDQRCAGEGTAWTIRMHLDCLDAYCSWQPDDEGSFLLIDYSEGHLPPCPQAWYGGEGDCTCAPAPPDASG